jgi:voltage-gated potassium channel
MLGYRALIRIATFVVLLIVTGATGYHFIEGWPWFEGLYMTVITIATVGYGEVMPVSTLGRLFTMALIVFGVSVMGYALTQMTSFVVEGHFNRAFRGRRLERMIQQMSDHYIVCGYGRIGRSVVTELVDADVPFLVITRESDTGDELFVNDREIPILLGDATDEDLLLRAGLERAKGVIAALPDDADNIMIAITTRDINLDTIVVARASNESSVRKLRRAGAHRVISPYDLGGRRMASLILRPSVMDFLDVIMHTGDVEIRLEEITLPSKSPLHGMTMRDAKIGERSGAIVLAVRTLDGKTITNPGAQHELKEWEQLIVMGRPDQINELREMSCT